MYAHVKICGLSFHDEQANPKYVSLDAEYVNATPHGLFLLDRHCPRGKGLQIDFPTTGMDANAARLKNDLWLIVRATGTFRGTLERDRQTGRLCLFVQSVINFQPEYMYPEHEPAPIRLPEPEWPKWPPN